MTKEQKLKAIIKKAEKNGWYTEFLDEDWKISKGGTMPMVYWGDMVVGGDNIIFSHDFLKCFFGKQVRCYEGFTDGEPYQVSWEHHAKQLVLSEDRIEYLAKYL